MNEINKQTENPVLWKPSDEQIANSNMQGFITFANDNYISNKTPISNYSELHAWSVAERENFWQAIWDFCEIKSSKRSKQVLVKPKTFPGSLWFPQARLNFAENLLSLNDDSPALLEYNENGKVGSTSFSELRQQVINLANYLRSIGIKPGDRIAAFLPNSPETIIAMMATSSIGAIWSSCSPDFGVQGVVDRFGQIQCKVLFACPEYQYAGKVISCTEKLQDICKLLPDLQQLIITKNKFSESDADISAFEKNGISAITFGDAKLAKDPDDFQFEQLPFDHPLYIMFSSGTTGAPKCIVHSAGGTLIQHLKEHQLHTDIKPGDTISYYTTCGWMMWNWLASALASKASLVLFDGSPFHPSPSVLLDIVDAEKVKVFGVSAKYISALEKEGLSPKHTHKLSSLRTLLSTGSPLSHESFEYVYREIKSDLCLSSIAGGTDIISCFVLGNPILPVRLGEIQCKGLGMDVDVFSDSSGNKNFSAVVGEKGELVCKQSFPSAPTGFWNDQDNAKYHKAYFNRFDNIWAHGDYAEQTQAGGFIIHGRSDSVLNPGGVRIGTAEIYRQVEKIDAIMESIVVGQSWQDDVRVVLFVKLRSGHSLDKNLEQEIKTVIRGNATPRHVPKVILAVEDIPRTKSGKIVELAVREVINGGEVKNKASLANPEALRHFQNRDELNQ